MSVKDIAQSEVPSIQDVMFETFAETKAAVRAVSRTEGWPLSFVVDDVLSLPVPEPSAETPQFPPTMPIDRTTLAGVLAGKLVADPAGYMQAACHVLLYKWLEMYRDERAIPKSRKRVFLEQIFIHKSSHSDLS